MVISAGCDSAGLDYEVPGAEALVHAFFEQGAVAYLGNTRAGFPDTEEHLLRATLQVALGLAPSATTSRALGEAFRQGKNYLDYLTAHRGPFHSTPPFEDYQWAMRREWTLLVYYGDPALELHRASPVQATGIPVRVSTAEDGARTIAIELTDEPARLPIWTEQIALGPVRELTGLSAAGLCYGTPGTTPGLGTGLGRSRLGRSSTSSCPAAPAALVTVVEGPQVLGPTAVVTDARAARAACNSPST
ncbi:MAG: C25 family cysteine peptidase [Planctomycetota bacterium]